MARRRCLMIGAGGFAGAWVRSFLPRFGDRLEVAALVDTRRDALDSAGDFLGLPANRRFSAIAEAFRVVEADFCIIVIPPAFHRDAVALAVERGLPILSEKPIADTWDACVEILRLVSSAGLKMQVVQNYRFTPRILTLQMAMRGLGRVNYLVSRFAADYRQRNSWGVFRHEIPHALLVEGSVHHFDQLRNLAGADCRTIAGQEWNPAWSSFNGESSGLYVMRFDNGVSGSYEGNCSEAGWQNSWHQEYYRAECEGGAVVLDRDNVVRIHEHTAGQGLTTREVPPVAVEYEGHQAIIRQFLDWLDGGSEPPTSLRDNIKSAAMLFGAIEASRTGQVVDVGSLAASAVE